MGIIKKQTITGTLFSYLGVALGFISTGLLFPRFLSKEQVGLLNVLVAYSVLFAQFGTLGINSVTNRFFPYYRNSNKKHQGYFLLLLVAIALGSSLVIGLLFGLKPSITANNIEKSPLLVDYYYLLFPLSIFSVIFLVFDTYIKVLYNAVYGLLIKEFVQRVFILLFLVLYIVQVISFNGFANLYITAFCIPAILLGFYLIRKKEVSVQTFTRSANTSWNDMLQVSFFGVIGGLSTIAISSIDRIMVNKFGGLDDAGVYSVAFYFGTLVLIPSRALIKISTPVLADAWKNNDMATIAEVYKKSCINQFSIAALLFLGIWLNVDSIFQVVSEEYAAGKYVILFIGLANVVDMATGVNQMIISTSKFFRYQTIFMLLLAALIIVTNYIFIPIMGITGAALASLISITLINGVRYVFIYVKFGFQPFSLSFLKVLVISALILMINNYVGSFSNYYVDMIVRGSLVLGVFISLLIALKVSDDINTSVKNIWDKRKAKRI